MNTKLVQLFLPWIGHDGIMNHSSMMLVFHDRMDKRVMLRAARKWYKKEIGLVLDKQTFRAIYQRRIINKPMDNDTMNQKLHDMAVRSREEIKAIPNSEL